MGQFEKFLYDVSIVEILFGALRRGSLVSIIEDYLKGIARFYLPHLSSGSFPFIVWGFDELLSSVGTKCRSAPHALCSVSPFQLQNSEQNVHVLAICFCFYSLGVAKKMLNP